MNGEPFPSQMAIAKNKDMRRFKRLEIFIRLKVCTGEEGDQNANANGEDDRRPLHVLNGMMALSKRGLKCLTE